MKKISITLLLCLLCLTGMAQGQKALDLKDITSGRFRPENIQGVIPMPDGEHYTQMNADGTQIIKYSFKTGEKVEVIFDVNTTRECDFKNFDSYQFSSKRIKAISVLSALNSKARSKPNSSSYTQSGIPLITEFCLPSSVTWLSLLP